MIVNIVDRRKKPYRWRKVNAVVEATSHDNSVSDSDQMEPQVNDLDYDELLGSTLSEAIAWGQRFESAVTLYIYDEGDGPERIVTVPASGPSPMPKAS